MAQNIQTVFQLTQVQRDWLEKTLELNRNSERGWWFDFIEEKFVIKVLGTDAYDEDGQYELNRLTKYYKTHQHKRN